MLKLAAVFLMLSFSTAEAKTLTIGPSPGGHVKAFMDIARAWCSKGYDIRITGTQQSAAAIRAVKLKQCGLNVCMTKGTLDFHLSSLGVHPSKLIGNYDKIGKLAYSFKSIHPSKFGIRKCK
jgi:hypothetical protein